jgi:protein SCO1/2
VYELAIVTEKAPPGSSVRRVRLLLWLLVALAVAGVAALLLFRSGSVHPDQATTSAPSSFGGPFTLVAADGKPFSSASLQGKPYAIYFGFTRCGDVCPTTLSRMTRLREQVGGPNKFNIVFVTIDPTHDGPKEVGQYATLFNSPIIGLTGTQAQIDTVKRQYGIFAEPSPHPMAGKEMEHTATVLLFDRAGSFVGTIAPDEPDDDALRKLKSLS